MSKNKHQANDNNQTPTYEYENDEIRAFAIQLKKNHPSITEAEMRKALSEKFIGKNNNITSLSTGFIANPISDAVATLSVVWNSLRKLVTQDKKKLLVIQKKIDHAVAELISPK